MDIFTRHNINGVLNARLNVLPFERWIVIPDATGLLPAHRTAGCARRVRAAAGAGLLKCNFALPGFLFGSAKSRRDGKKLPQFDFAANTRRRFRSGKTHQVPVLNNVRKSQ